MRSGYRFFGLFLLSVTLMGQVLAAQEGLPPEILAYPDMVLHNGKILTANNSFTIAEAVAIRDGRFLAVGDNRRILRMAGPNTRVIDVGGKTVLPGFVNTHYHLSDMAEKDYIDLEDAVAVLKQVEKLVRETEPGEWVVQYYQGTRAGAIVGKITKTVLDSISPRNPVVVVNQFDNHVLLNSPAMKELNIPDSLAGREKVMRDQSGELTGEFFDDAARFLSLEKILWFPAIQPAFQERLKEGIAEQNARGITTLHTRVNGHGFTALRDLWARGDLTLRWRAALTFFRSGGSDFPEVGNLSEVGDDMLRISGYAPGSVDGWAWGGSWTWEPKRRVVEKYKSNPYGNGEEEWPEMREMIVRAATYGWNVVGVHSAGDRATAEVFKAYEELANQRLVKSAGQALRIDHLQHVRDEDMLKAKRLPVTVAPSIAAWKLFRALEQLDYMYGPERVSGLTKVKGWIAAGLKPAGELNRSCPFWNIQKFVTRKDDDGRLRGPQEKVSREEALWMHTVWAASYIGEQEKLGSIETGKLADLFVLNGDYLTVPEDEMVNLPVLMTILGGKIVFQTEQPGYVCVDTSAYPYALPAEYTQ